MPEWTGTDEELEEEMLDAQGWDEYDKAMEDAERAVEEMKKSVNGLTAMDIDQASARQVGGDHYRRLTIQPSDYILQNNLNWLEGNAIKYITRHSVKGGAQDIDKAIHYLELLKEWAYGKA